MVFHIAQIKDTESNICQIAAIKDGRQVFSETYNGYSKSDCCHIASATKSIVGLLVGIAIDQRKIGRIDDSGNVIYVNSEANAVVAVTSFFKPSVSGRIDFAENIMKNL